MCSGVRFCGIGGSGLTSSFSSFSVDGPAAPRIERPVDRSMRVAIAGSGFEDVPSAEMSYNVNRALAKAL